LLVYRLSEPCESLAYEGRRSDVGERKLLVSLFRLEFQPNFFGKQGNTFSSSVQFF
jgi:hypothetical protein